jgi:hypothetical protein
MTPREIQDILDKPWDDASAKDIEAALSVLLSDEHDAGKKDEVAVWLRYVAFNLIKETGRLHDQLQGLRPPH